MVAYSACDNIVYSQCVNNSYKRQFCFSSYVCGVLIMKTDERIKTLRDIISLILIFLVLYLINGKKYFVYFSLFLLFICLFENKLIVFISKFLSKFSLFVYRAIAIIALGIIFYFILTPISWLWRIFNKNSYFNFTKNYRNTTFINVNKKFDKEFFYKSW